MLFTTRWRIVPCRFKNIKMFCNYLKIILFLGQFRLAKFINYLKNNPYELLKIG